ncbi:MAG: ATP-binding protein [Candidatus Micrarchaeota archaeon]|nr:ATP-binding protein [Candidatus Micrarchaeota archaeon]MDE1859657.1 ATP-binding protein [Candidatus Micrarchaeota archaeon]
MGLVRIQKVMSDELAKRVFLSRLPEPPYEYIFNDPADSIFIGTTKRFNVPFTWTFNALTNPHISVVGITGSGKSFFVKTFLVRSSYIWGTNALIIDWAGEYKAWVKQSGGVVVSLGKGDTINMMDLGGARPIDRAKQIMTSLDIISDISDFPEQRRLTAEALEQAYVNAGFILTSVPPPSKDAPTLKDVARLLEEKLQEGTYEYPAELENAIYRLRQYSREGQDYFAKKSSIDFGKVINSGLVDLDLSGLPDEKFRALAALFILQTLKEKMRAQTWSATKGIKVMVVLDEAWKVASDERSDAITIVREGRKYQFGLIVASQNPTDINEAIFSNVGTNIILRIKFQKFIDYIQGSLNFSIFIRNEISRLGVGEAAVDMSFQTSVQFPSTFIINRIVGEVPLDSYTITLADMVTDAELRDQSVPKEFIFERLLLNSKLVESNVSTDLIESIIMALDKRNRIVDLKEFISIMLERNVAREHIVSLMRNMGIPDTIIGRAFAYK